MYYDSNGNQTSRTISGTAYTLSYDAENRLVSVTWPGSNSMSFTFDGDGNRVKSSSQTVPRPLSWALIMRSLAVRSPNIIMQAPHSVAMRTSSGVRYIFGDHLGSTSITADGSGGNSRAALQSVGRSEVLIGKPAHEICLYRAIFLRGRDRAAVLCGKVLRPRPRQVLLTRLHYPY